MRSKLSPIEQLFPINGSADLSTANDRRFVEAIRNAYDLTTARFPKARMMGVQAKLGPTERYTALQVVFTNPYLTSKDKSLVVQMNPQTWGEWMQPRFVEKDYSVGNKILWRLNLQMDMTEAVEILKKTYPRVTITAAYLVWPRSHFDFPDQPYFIFFLANTRWSKKYLWVGMSDREVWATDTLPDSLKPSDGGHGYLEVS